MYIPKKREQYAAEKRGGTAKAPHLFVQSLRLFFAQKALHFVCRAPIALG